MPQSVHRGVSVRRGGARLQLPCQRAVTLRAPSGLAPPVPRTAPANQAPATLPRRKSLGTIFLALPPPFALSSLLLLHHQHHHSDNEVALQSLFRIHIRPSRNVVEFSKCLRPSLSCKRPLRAVPVLPATARSPAVHRVQSHRRFVSIASPAPELRSAPREAV